MICGNRLLNQVTTERNDVIKPWTLLQELTRVVEKFSCDKLILVFHNHVLKQPEECKTLCKFPSPLSSKTNSIGLWKIISAGFQPSPATVFEKSSRLPPLTESFRKNE